MTLFNSREVGSSSSVPSPGEVELEEDERG